MDYHKSFLVRSYSLISSFISTSFRNKPEEERQCKECTFLRKLEILTAAFGGLATPPRLSHIPIVKAALANMIQGKLTH